MDPVKNPFAPGAGSPPPELAGRDELLERARIALLRLKDGRHAKSLILLGLRGVGKTVLLNEIKEIAQKEGYLPATIESTENKRLALLLIPEVRRILFKISAGEKVNQSAKRALGVFRSFINSIKIKMDDFEFGLDIQPEKGEGDSGDLDADLSALFVALGEAAKSKSQPILFSIDEIQYLNEDDLSALIMAFHQMSQKQLPVVLVGAGLPQLAGLAGNAKSYAERLFDFVTVGPLNRQDAGDAIHEPITREGAHIEGSALDEIFSVTSGYPYFLQTWGYESWNAARQSPITRENVEAATPIAITRLDESFFRVRFDRLTPSEKKYLRAMAELGPGPHRSGDIAELLKRGVQQVAPLRNGLIKKGMIYSPAHGDTMFTVPLFDQYLRRVVPQFEN
jgi:AAA ATPase domain